MMTASAPSMVTGSIDIAELAAAQRAVVLLCPPEARLGTTRQLRAQLHGSAQLERCEVTEISRWLAGLWDRAMLDRVVLRPAQLQALLRSSIADTGGLAANVLRPAAIEREFMRAFDIAVRYRVDTSGAKGITATPEQESFQRWREALQLKLDGLGAVTQGQMPARLCEYFDQVSPLLPARIVLHPRLRLCTTEAEFLERCAASGIELLTLTESETTAAVIQQFSAIDPLTEIDAMARWVAQQLRDADPGPARVALILAPGDLRRDDLDRALARYLHPDLLVPGEDSAEELLEPWQYRSGGSLADFPVVQIALDIAALAGRSVPLEQLSRVLRSSFVLDAAPQRAARAILDRELRETLPPMVSMQLVAKRVPERHRDAWQVFAGMLDVISTVPRRQSAAAWALTFNQLLKCVGWPARDTGDGVVDQCRKALAQTLDVLRSLDDCCAPMRCEEAWQWWREIVNSKRFELRRDVEAPVQILDFNDAGEEQFDAVWVLGLSDRALPQAPLYSPFLSRETMLAAQVPDCDATAVLQRDQDRLARILASAPMVCLSMSQFGDDESEQRPCPLVDWDQQPPPLTTAPALLWQAQLTQPDADVVKPVAETERQSLQGGVSVFSNIARSPFVAFCRHRLGLRAFPDTVEGLTASEQGEWVHSALRTIWGVLGDSDALSRATEAELIDIVSSAVADTLPGWMFFDDWHGEVLMSTERERIVQLLLRWLAYEEQRELPFAVVAREAPIERELHRIPLRLVIDRVDRIDGERYVLIDYKTGKVQARELNAGELLAPQLPVYALLAAPELVPTVNGVALAQVSDRHGCGLYLRSDWVKELVTKARSSQRVCTEPAWQAELQAWDNVLAEMAAQFLSGDIRHAGDCNASRFDYDGDLAPLWSVLEYGR